MKNIHEIGKPYYEKLTVLENLLRKQNVSGQDEILHLNMANRSFPSVDGFGLSEALSLIALWDGHVLEVGGGAQQGVAREVVSQFPTLSLHGLEVRPLTGEAQDELTMHPNFYRIDNGISAIPQLLSERRFDVVFAHNVASSLPNPFLIIQYGSEIVDEGGFIYCNSIPLYRDRLSGIVRALESQEVLVAVNMRGVGSPFLQSGVILADISLRRGKNPFVLNGVDNGPLSGFDGTKLIAHDIEFHY